MGKWTTLAGVYRRALSPPLVLAIVALWAAPVRAVDDTLAERCVTSSPVEVCTAITSTVLGATGMSADRGLGEDGGIHFIDVRIVTELGLDLTLTSSEDLDLASAPRLCLTGPYWNPLDAGLSDRCWGEPDLTSLLEAQLGRTTDGRVIMPAGEPIEFHLDLRRGDVRCDYPPGSWDLELSLEPAPGERVYLDDVEIEVPLEPEGTVLPFYYTGETRFCTYAQTILLEQGEPTTAPTPAPGEPASD
jgi:hypothetical protein